MSTFVKGGGVGTPFGRNEFLRSTKRFQTESYTFAAASLPAVTIDGNAGQKILQPGLVLAKITDGPDAGKVGPFQAGVVDGRADLRNIVGLCLTFLPWQLIERDVEVSAVYDCVAVQGWCFELDAAGLYITLTNTTADALYGLKGLQVNFK